MGGTALERRVERAAEAALAQRRYVTAIDVFIGVGWLAPVDLDRWRQGRVPCLERVVVASLPKLTKAMTTMRRWATSRGLTPSETAYVARGRSRRPLRFSVSGSPAIERAYRTHWVSPELSARKRSGRDATSAASAVVAATSSPGRERGRGRPADPTTVAGRTEP